MFSHIVTAAKGLFSRPQSDDSPSRDSPINPTQSTASGNHKMVTATRRRTFSPIRPDSEVNGNGAKRRTGKRKSGADISPAVEVQVVKKRKASPEPASEAEDVSQIAEPEPEVVEKSQPEQIEKADSPKPSPPAKTKHFRFDSEEPEQPLETPEDDVPEQQPEEEESDSDDDEAPEAVTNSAQMSRMRLEAKKQEETRQREEQLRKEKRKKLDELRKSQAVNKKKDLPDDLLSESTATLQGSITQDARRAALPALLPDDILNAAPTARPPTPPAEEDYRKKKPSKLKFLEKTEKRPRDVHMGDVTIRVLDENVSRKKAKVSLPPKATKSSINSKQSWMNRARSTGQVNGLRRTTGGSSGFVRK